MAFYAPVTSTGCTASLFPVIMVDLLGLELVEKSIGLCISMTSPAFIIAAPLSGKICSIKKAKSVSG